MGSCLRPNYKGPAVGVWALALALEFAVGTLMIVVGSQRVSDVSPELEGIHLNFHEGISKIIASGNAWRTVHVFGWLHLVVTAVCGLFAVLGMLVCGIFLCPLCILGWVQTAFCVVSTITTAAYLRGYLNTLPDATDETMFSSGDIFFAQMNSGGLLAASVLSLAAAVVMSRATSTHSGDSAPGISLMVYSMGLFASIGALLAAGGGGWAPTPAFSALWVILTVLGAVFMKVRSCMCECPKACNILMVIVFGVGTVLSLLTAVVMAHIYLTVIRDPKVRPDFTTLFFIMERGMGLVVAAALSIACFVMSAWATFYSARSIICCGEGVSSA